jgi:hypothetical protein
VVDYLASSADRAAVVAWLGYDSATDGATLQWIANGQERYLFRDISKHQIALAEVFASARNSPAGTIEDSRRSASIFFGNTDMITQHWIKTGIPYYMFYSVDKIFVSLAAALQQHRQSLPSKQDDK